ncbi:DUF6090 family protein [Croceivirga thetidis]|uniref:Uncharacterized protein n=1 Tax=Croceivirga thetidis TaxID=2721623 RepID=A0ABX1GPD0_9FLAO|nr:DUF6090 family protein [Croceivirga thetidis]NKI30925.1 hypothetical protein [Croceivirga thetidis]
MIKFFRRLRQKLLSENELSKYLLYAVGEIVLVVIGILIALQLNSMREEQKAREKEQSYLKELHYDFTYNKNQLDSIIAHNTTAIKAAIRVSEIIEKMKKEVPANEYLNYPLVDSILPLQDMAFSNMSFNPKNGTVQALINSSTFDLIQNDSLRRNLISWKDVLDDYLEEEEFAMKFLFEEYQPWIRSNYQFQKGLSRENLEILVSPQEFNYRITRIGDLDNLLNTVETEGIVKTIDDILRMTAQETNND